MKQPVKVALKSLLFMALEEDWGIIVDESNPLKLRAALYTVRGTDPLFSVLSFVLSPTNPERELWIIKTKREREVPDGEEI